MILWPSTSLMTESGLSVFLVFSCPSRPLPFLSAFLSCFLFPFPDAFPVAFPAPFLLSFPVSLFLFEFY
jgi:hypothetical protein